MSETSGNWYSGLSRKARRRLNKRMGQETKDARTVIAWAIILTDVYSTNTADGSSEVDTLALERLSLAVEPYRSLIADAP